MANPTVPTPRPYVFSTVNNNAEYPISGAAVVYEGTALSDVSSTGPGVAGTNVAAALTAGENFLGFADRTSLLNDTSIPVRTEGIAQLVVAGVTAASIGAKVFASDGGTFTLTAGSNSKIGEVTSIVAGTTVLVHFKGVGLGGTFKGFTGGGGNDLTHFTFVDGICTAAS